MQATITNAVLNDTGTAIELFGTGNVDLGTITLATATSAQHVDWFTDAGHAGSVIGSGTDIVLSDTVCFAAGTRILTASGEQAIETLRPGDTVITLSSNDLVPRPVKWIGRRRINIAAHPRPETVAPVRIRRGAFAEAMPHSDLVVSPDHAIYVDGKLICARQLLNGTTIRQERHRTAVEYVHVELDSHAVLLAEGLPAESYLDTGNRGFFANADEPLMLHPDLTDEADCPAREAASCAPFVWDEASVRPVWQRLADRAAELGQPAPAFDSVSDPELRIVVNGRIEPPLSNKDGLYVFAVAQGVTEVRVVSLASSPTDTRPWLEDRRRLGVYVERIAVDDAGQLCDDTARSSGAFAGLVGGRAGRPDVAPLDRWRCGAAAARSRRPEVAEAPRGQRRHDIPCCLKRFQAD